MIIRRRRSNKRPNFKDKAELDNEGERPRYEAPGSQPLKSISESDKLLTPPPPFSEKEILGPHPGFASDAPSVTVSELRGEGHIRSHSGSTYPRHEMHGSEFVPIELLASSAQAQELLGSSPAPAQLSDHSSMPSIPLMSAVQETASPTARSSGASPVRTPQGPSTLDRVTSLRGLFGRPGYKRQNTTDLVPSAEERGGEFF